MADVLFKPLRASLTTKELTKSEIQNIFGDTVEADIPVDELLDEVNRKYEVFHLILDRYGALGGEVGVETPCAEVAKHMLLSIGRNNIMSCLRSAIMPDVEYIMPGNKQLMTELSGASSWASGSSW